MLKTKAVLVLGAGALVPFNFPTGIQLSEKIMGAGKHTLVERLHFAAEDVDTFKNTFYRSGKNSVDGFLEHRPEFMRIGKACTAMCLIPSEEEQQYFRFGDSWLRVLYNNLNTSFEGFADNKLAFVTFNYDRTIEHFLFTALQNSHDKPDEDFTKILDAIPIIHLHGSLGSLPWQKLSFQTIPSRRISEEHTHRHRSHQNYPRRHIGRSRQGI